MNTPTQQHTPTPWTAEGCYIHAADGTRFLAVCGDRHGHRPDDNAAFIVRACNSHAALVAAAQNAANVLAALATGQIKSIRPDSPALSQLRAALAQAR